ncbi:hypothetical protein B9N43_01770 [Denitratisoma sp. DHT3]|nr:hypothetical protein B9N43_01770 [Denitratisoma sp. DHT3]
MIFCLVSIAHAAVPPLPTQTWKELTPQQQQILQPLAEDWDGMPLFRRKKWLGIAERYAKLTPEEQTRIQRRMKAWVRLTPDERRTVREQFKALQKAPPEKRESLKLRWEQYLELSENEKLHLKRQSPRQPWIRSLMGSSQSPTFVRPDIPRNTEVPVQPTPQSLNLPAISKAKTKAKAKVHKPAVPPPAAPGTTEPASPVLAAP